MMIDLYDTATDKLVGTITEADFQHIAQNLEAESLRDTDYYFQRATVELLGTDGLATDHLLAVLRSALGTSEGVELRWERREGRETT